MPGPPQIAVAGEIFIDLVMSGIQGWPEAGKEVFASKFHREIGGGAPITACGLARLGSSTGILGVAGTDTGDWVADRLKGNGVCTDWLAFDREEPTAFTVVATTPEDRAFLTYAGANRGLYSLLNAAGRTRQFAGVTHIHLACAPPIESTAELLDHLHDLGCTISLDIGWREDWLKDKDAMTILRKVDIFFPNELEGRELTGKSEPLRILRAFEENGVKCVALKLGSRGSALLFEGKIISMDAHPANPLDTTGAGDSFNAGYLHQMINHQSPEKCLRSASICAALSTEALGGINGFPSIEQLQHELDRYPSCEK